MAAVVGSYLLATLNLEDRARLDPHFEQIELSRGAVLAHQGEALPYIYFPQTAIISLVCDMRDGRVAEMATFGREALIGLPFRGVGTEVFGRYVVQIPGTLLRIRTGTFQEAAACHPGIQEMVSRYTEILIALTLQSVACNSAHSVEERCCRWIMASSDRTDRVEVPLTHEFLAEMLGVQRSTVSETLGTLQRRGLISQGRGTVTILDRPRLEGTACECYRILRDRYRELLPVRGSFPEPGVKP